MELLKGHILDFMAHFWRVPQPGQKKQIQAKPRKDERERGKILLPASHPPTEGILLGQEMLVGEVQALPHVWDTHLLGPESC